MISIALWGCAAAAVVVFSFMLYSVASFNLFWRNQANSRKSNVVRATSVVGDPLLDAEFHLRSGSPAVDAGTARFAWRGKVVMDQSPSSYQGAAPDIGWYERRQ